jgi:hypothetical protein
MAERVVRTAHGTATPARSLPLLGRAHALAMEPRLRLRIDGHAPDFLHPGRSALILLLDVGEADPGVLAAAMLTESERPELRVSRERIVEALAPEGDESVVADVARWVAEVPLPGDDDLVERLVIAEPEVQRVALAERLDQLRHAHLWGDVERMRAVHALAEAVYAPFAVRVHPRLAHRFERSCTALARKHLL